jgi:hypothetical protein
MTRSTTIVLAMAGWLTTSELVGAQPVTTAMAGKEAVLSGVLMQPQGDFRRALQTVGGGGGIHLLFPIRSGQVSAGIDGQLLFYPTERYRLNPTDQYRQDHEMILTVHGLVRLHQRSDSRRGYVEALGGIKGFSFEESSRIGTFSYGVGAGMQFPFVRRTTAGVAQRHVVEIGLRYLRGGGARLGSQMRASSTHSIMLHVGVGIPF